MKKFILLSYSLGGMGGGQMYQNNKLNFMIKNGYNSTAIYSKKDDIIIKDLKKYAKNYIELLSINPILLSKRKINIVIDEIVSLTGNIDNNTIIESNNKVSAIWGEIIAQKYNALNVVYIIDEKVGSLDKTLVNFFEFKRKRLELFGIKEETYEMIFNEKPIERGYSYILPLVCSNVVSEYSNEILTNIEYSELNLATIGRLEKDYVPTLLEEIKKFANNHSDITITYVMVGGSNRRGDFKKIRNIFKEVKNLKLFLVGNIFPIPIDFLNQIDIFVSSAGSAIVSCGQGKPTITIDARDYHSIGILNYDTKNMVFRENEEKITICDKLEFLYRNQLYKNIEIEKFDAGENDIDSVLSPHIDRYNILEKNTREYFDFFESEISKFKKFEKIVLNVFGIKIYQKIRYYIFKRVKR